MMIQIFDPTYYHYVVWDSDGSCWAFSGNPIYGGFWMSVEGNVRRVQEWDNLLDFDQRTTTVFDLNDEVQRTVLFSLIHL